MSKKLLHNRLNSLFADLEGNQEPAAPESMAIPTEPGALTTSPAPLAVWNWSTDPAGCYQFCGPEIMDGLGTPPAEWVGHDFRTCNLHDSTIARLNTALAIGVYPTELDALLKNSSGEWTRARMHLLNGPGSNGSEHGWRGMTQVLAETTPEQSLARPHISAYEPADTLVLRRPPTVPPVTVTETAIQPFTDQPTPTSTLTGVAMEQNNLKPSTRPWTKAGQESMITQETVIQPADPRDPAAIAVPFKVDQMGDMVIELLDETTDRTWSEDERTLVSEVANQLTLALENARLYMAAQQELAERVRAEQIILHRNQDLATLNRIGQRLSSLTSRTEVMDTLSEMVGQVLDNRNLYVCTYDAAAGTISFPVYREDGIAQILPDRPFGKGIAEYIIQAHHPLLITSQTAEELKRLDIVLPEGERVPLSLLAIPIVSGDKHIGALVVKNYEQENANQFDDVHVELLSTAVAQASTALENANLFNQMQNALQAVETRERYQAGVALAAASLSEYGTESLPEVLKHLGQAAQCSRVYFARFSEENSIAAWHRIATWTAPSLGQSIDRLRNESIPLETFRDQLSELKTSGWILPLDQDANSPAARFFTSQNIRSALIISVPGKDSAPDLLLFDQFDQPRQWLTEEVNILRVAADAVANTYVREDLLGQVQSTLDETESLYNASNRLVTANDFQEMLAAVINGVKVPDINRGTMLLFDLDAHNKLAKIMVRANWYSGYGTPPPPVGTEYPRSVFERALQINDEIFIEDLSHASMDEVLRQHLLKNGVNSLSILPMWSGKRQIGALLLEGETIRTFSGREKRIFPPLVDQLTISVENLRLFEQTQKALSETAVLYNMSNSIAQALNADEMLNLTVKNVLPHGADRAALMLLNYNDQDEIEDLELAGYYDKRGDKRPLGVYSPISTFPIVRMLPEDGIAIHNVDDFELDPSSRATLERLEVRSLSITPLRTSGRMTGILFISSRTPIKFDPAELRTLRVISSGIAVALEKQHLLLEAQRRALELQTASEIARDTTSTLSLDILLSRIVNMIIDRFKFYHTSIFLVDESGTFASVRESSGTAGAEMKQRGHRLAVGSRSVVGTVTASGEPFILNDVTNSPMYYANPLLPETRAEMGLPLKLGNRVIGALDLQASERNAFSKDDVNVLSILTDQIAIAIENARAYELSQKAFEDMREADRVKSQFLANMSHELRTPLNSIIGFSRVIIKGIDGPINEMQTQDLSAIYNSGQHLLGLINDILDLSKIEAGKMDLSIGDVNIADMVNSAMSTAIGLVKDKPIKLVQKVDPDLPTVRADATRTRQVLINFLSNAAKFTDQGDITVHAKKNIAPDGRPEIMVTVTDSGPGISEPDQVKLFLPFSQVDDSPTRKTGGTGLGLSICRSLIDMHGGRIGLLSSTVGQGSTFFFTLPLPYTEGTGKDGLPGDANVVMSIDDDLQVIGLYQRFLQPQGYRVVAHTEPKTAVEAAKKLKPFAITLDVMMPERDGWQVMNELKNDPETRNIPIIVCSILEEEEKGFSLGAADYLVKPFLQEDLLNAMNRLNQDGKIHKILIIDDDPEDQRLVRKMVEEDKRFQAKVADGGKMGWNLLQQEIPDAIILDLFMPDMDGFTILTNMRTDPALKDIPVLILTGADLTPEQLQKLNDMGQQLMTKGFLREKELLNTLEVALRNFKKGRNR